MKKKGHKSFLKKSSSCIKQKNKIKKGLFMVEFHLHWSSHKIWLDSYMTDVFVVKYIDT